MDQRAPLQFLPLNTSISPSFWHRLTALKLHSLGLDDKPLPLRAHYSQGKTVQDKLTGDEIGISGALELDEGSFDTDVGDSPPRDRFPLNGTLRNFNTIEEFKRVDKAQLLQELGDQIWSSITSPATNTSLATLNPFLLITFADLKKYRYYYWCAFPALVQKPGWQVIEGWKEVEAPQLQQLEHPVLLTRADGSEAQLAESATFWANSPPEERTLVFNDPSSHPTALGWPVRNALSFLTLSPSPLDPPIRKLRILSLRGDKTLSCVIALEDAPPGEEKKRPAVVGWEKNDAGKLGPRMADLAPLMDPKRLADQAVDLNLQLMRWRILPSLDLDKVKNTRVLLLGAGTLGCYVARTLMAWGVRAITLVDSSTVSFSNPVRQPLFEFEDSLGGGKPKAEAAAAALRRVYPGVNATGLALSVPMPGHPIPPSSLDSTRADFDTLEKLVDEHDVVYLLMDSRESRWLPTVMGAAKGKLVMNVALGFDTFLAMRHGLPSLDSPNSPSTATPAPLASSASPFRGKLGCYYCNDVVAPQDVRPPLPSSPRVEADPPLRPPAVPHGPHARPAVHRHPSRHRCNRERDGGRADGLRAAAPARRARPIRRRHLPQRFTRVRRARQPARHRPAPDPWVPRTVREPQDHGAGVRPVHGVLRGDPLGLPRRPLRAGAGRVRGRALPRAADGAGQARGGNGGAARGGGGLGLGGGGGGGRFLSVRRSTVSSLCCSFYASVRSLDLSDALDPTLRSHAEALLRPALSLPPLSLEMASTHAEHVDIPSLHALTLSPSPAPPSASSPSSSAAPPHAAFSAPHTAPASDPARATPREEQEKITYRAYQSEEDLDAIVALVDEELSEPYNLYTYRYFLDEWPHLCFFALANNEPVGVIICKQEPHTKSSRSLPVQSEGEEGQDGGQEGRRPLMRGYLAMLSTKKAYRGRGVATHLLRLSLSVMLRPPSTLLASLPEGHPSLQPVDEVVLETEADNLAALAFYAKMGFVREKRLYRFYLNGKDAYRLRLDLSVCIGAEGGAVEPRA